MDNLPTSSNYTYHSIYIKAHMAMESFKSRILSVKYEVFKLENVALADKILFLHLYIVNL